MAYIPENADITSKESLGVFRSMAQSVGPENGGREILQAVQLVNLKSGAKS
jgi:hypothetical protein